MEFTRDERLEALNYSIYMIAASYFKSAKCLSKGQEAHGLLLYKLLGNNEQYRMEDCVIAMMEKKVLSFLPDDFVETDVKVQILPYNGGVRIYCPGHQLKIRGLDSGRRLRIVCDYTPCDSKNNGICLEYPEKKRSASPKSRE